MDQRYVADRRARTPASAAKHNVGRIATLLEEQQRTLSPSERISQGISRFAGSLAFVAVHLAAFLAWACWNVLAPAPWRFDPYPFGLLTMVVSLEGVLVATFVLVTQNRLSQLADRRDHLHLQIDMLAEQETTEVIRMLREISAQLQVPQQNESKVEELAQETDVNELLHEIQRKVPVE